MATRNSRAALTLAASLTVLSPSLLANPAEIEALKKQVQTLTARLQHLENSNQQRSGVLIAQKGSEAVSFFGVVEVEASYNDHDIDGSSSDLAVATVELGVAAQLGNGYSAAVTILYEEDDTDLEVDVATITKENIAGTGLSITLGQTYLPFGGFETYLINDTLALEMAEARETAAIISWQKSSLSAFAYVFNGDLDKGADTLENFGTSISWNNDSFSLGADYISNILDSDGLSSMIENDGIDLGDVETATGAYSIRASASLSAVTLLAEYVDTESFTVGSFIDRDINALHLEAATDLGDWTVALAWQETDNAADILPEKRISLAASTSLTDHVGLGVEYWHDQDYSGDESNNLLLQLSVEF